MFRTKIWREIYEGESDKVEETSINENPREDIKDKFLSALCERISKILEINHNDRKIVILLLRSNLEEILTDRKEGLLNQFLHHELEIIGNEINVSLGIKEKICTSHATHAKLSNHVDAIRKKIEAASSMLYDRPIEVKENGGGCDEQDQKGEDTKNSNQEEEKGEEGS